MVARAVELGRFTPDELAVPTHRKGEKEQNAAEGRLAYAIWRARDRGLVLDGDTGGHQLLTELGLANVGAPTGYPELDARRRAPRSRGRKDPATQLRPYVAPRLEGSEARSLGDAVAHVAFDLDLIERRTREHHRLQQAAEKWLTGLGWKTGLAPSGTVLADLMAEKEGQWIVVEVKTLDSERPPLATQQLRLGLGQVLDYRQRLRAIRAETADMLVVSRAPADPTWSKVTAAADISLIWPPFTEPAARQLERHLGDRSA